MTEFILNYRNIGTVVNFSCTTCLWQYQTKLEINHSIHACSTIFHMSLTLLLNCFYLHKSVPLIVITSPQSTEKVGCIVMYAFPYYIFSGKFKKNKTYCINISSQKKVYSENQLLKCSTLLSFLRNGTAVLFEHTV